MEDTFTQPVSFMWYTANMDTVNTPIGDTHHTHLLGHTHLLVPPTKKVKITSGHTYKLKHTHSLGTRPLTVDSSSTVGVSVCGMVDSSLPQFPSLLLAHLIAIATVQHSIGIGGARPHTEHVMSETCAICVHIVQPRTLQDRTYPSGQYPSGQD